MKEVKNTEEMNEFLKGTERTNNPQEAEEQDRLGKKKRPLLEQIRKCENLCSKKHLLKRLPVITWMKNYRKEYLINDFTTGITVGLTAIPQGIAYAVVAGLPPEYGLYSGFMACFIYFLLGTIKELNIGPTAIMALMTQESVEKYNSDFAVLLCFITGCVILLLGILHLGFLVNFISTPVIVGFGTAAAVTIGSSQLKGLLGISGKSHQFLESWISVISHVEETKYEDLILGLLTISFLVGTKVLSDRVSRALSKRPEITKRAKCHLLFLRYFSLARNGIAVIFGTVAAYLFEIYGMSPFKLTGEVQSGLPDFGAPPFSTTVKIDNETREVNFMEMASLLETKVLSVPFVSVLETITIAKTFARGKILDATQEMIALGVANVAGSFVHSMPTAGSFTRSALNSASGIKTPLGSLFTGILVLSALSLTKTFQYIPKATLAGVIITAMYYSIDYREILTIWRTRKWDLVPLIVTIVGCLFLGLDYGILLGVLVSLLFVLFRIVKPRIAQEEQTTPNEEILLIQPQEMLAYPGAERLRTISLKASTTKTKNLIVIDGRNIFSVDTTVAKTVKALTEDFKNSEQDFVFWNWPEKSVKTCLKLDRSLEEYFVRADTVEKLLEARKTAAGKV